MNSIDLSSYGNWTPIGTSYSPFTGILDGNGYNVYALNISEKASLSQGQNYYGGIFGYANEAEFRNINANGNYSVVIVPGAYAGTTIISIGGICGYSRNTLVESCTNNISISCEVLVRSDGGSDSGSQGRVSPMIGGIIGTFYEFSGNISNCANNGNISVKNFNGQSSTSCGGIFGKNSTGNTGILRVVNCINKGTISAYGDSQDWHHVYAGGLVGECNQISFVQCSSYGNITSTGITYSDYYATYGCVAGAGGLAGRGLSDYSYQDCNIYANSIKASAPINAYQDTYIGKQD